MRWNRSVSLFMGLLLWVAAGCSKAYQSGGSGSGSGSGSSGGTGSQVVVVVSPSATSVSVFATQTFSATVTGTTNTAVTWEVNGVAGGSQTTGFISSAGVFVAPGGVPTKSDGSGNSVVTTVNVQAVSQASASAVGTAVLTITAPNQQAQGAPVKLGTSGGDVNDTGSGFCCGGTLGALVSRAGTQYILSNTHVLAKSDFATIGDAISQPSIIDVPSPNTCTAVGTQTVANLSTFYNLQTGPLPKVDAAIAQVVSGEVDPSGNILLLGATQTGGIPDAGAPHAGTGVPAVIGRAVAKSGRTTGLTCSTVLGVNVAANVGYVKNCGDKTTAFTVDYTDLVSVAGGAFSGSGDSGSIIVTQDTADPVALLFAGSDADTVGNPVSDVLAAFPTAGGVTPVFVGGGTHQVIGCTLPLRPTAAVVPQARVTAQAATRAGLVRDLHAPELLTAAGVQAIGVGPSYDRAGEAAILLFVEKGTASTALPRSIEGVATRVIPGVTATHQGVLSDAESVEMLRVAAAPQLVYELRAGELARARLVHTAHKDALLKQAGIVGVGITSSVDAPGEAALLIYMLRGTPHAEIPTQIDGLRTRLRETSAFVAGRGNPGRSSGCKAQRSAVNVGTKH